VHFNFLFSCLSKFSRFGHFLHLSRSFQHFSLTKLALLYCSNFVVGHPPQFIPLQLRQLFISNFPSSQTQFNLLQTFQLAFISVSTFSPGSTHLTPSRGLFATHFFAFYNEFPIFTFQNHSKMATRSLKYLPWTVF